MLTVFILISLKKKKKKNLKAERPTVKGKFKQAKSCWLLCPSQCLPWHFVSRRQTLATSHSTHSFHSGARGKKNGNFVFLVFYRSQLDFFPFIESEIDSFENLKNVITSICIQISRISEHTADLPKEKKNSENALNLVS